MFNLPSDCLSKSHSALLPQCLCCISSRKKFSKLATAAHTQFVEYGHLQKLGTAQKYESRGGTSDFRLHTSYFRLQTSDFRLQTSDFRLQTSDFRLHTSYFRLQTSDFRLQTFRVRT